MRPAENSRKISNAMRRWRKTFKSKTHRLPTNIETSHARRAANLTIRRERYGRSLYAPRRPGSASASARRRPGSLASSVPVARNLSAIPEENVNMINATQKAKKKPSTKRKARVSGKETAAQRNIREKKEENSARKEKLNKQKSSRAARATKFSVMKDAYASKLKEQSDLRKSGRMNEADAMNDDLEEMRSEIEKDYGNTGLEDLLLKIRL